MDAQNKNFIQDYLLENEKKSAKEESIKLNLIR